MCFWVIHVGPDSRTLLPICAHVCALQVKVLVQSYLPSIFLKSKKIISNTDNKSHLWKKRDTQSEHQEKIHKRYSQLYKFSSRGISSGITTFIAILTKPKRSHFTIQLQPTLSPLLAPRDATSYASVSDPCLEPHCTSSLSRTRISSLSVLQATVTVLATPFRAPPLTCGVTETPG